MVFCLLVIIWGVTTMLPGEGVQSRLDASHGLDEVYFPVSLRKAMEKMTLVQAEAIEWAMMNIPNEEIFLARYGASPTIRQIIVGEVMRVVDEKRQQVAALESTFPDIEGKIKFREASLSSLNKLLQNYEPTITYIGYPEDGADGDLIVRYRFDKAVKVQLKELPCLLTYRVRYLVRQHQIAFNCLAQAKAINDEFYVQVAGIRTMLERARGEMKQALNYKSVL